MIGESRIIIIIIMIICVYFIQPIFTPLHFSAANGRLETCRLLLQCNADPEVRGKECQPALVVIFNIQFIGLFLSAKTPPFMFLLVEAAFTPAACCWRRTQTSPQPTGTPSCSRHISLTCALATAKLHPTTYAIDENEADVAACLRRV
jgi:hypothetical protein